MTKVLSRHTIDEYLPEIKGICAGIEVELTRHDLDHLLELQPLPALEQYGRLKINYAMMLLNVWLNDTAFTTKHSFFQKNDVTAKWSDMLQIINGKIHEHQNDVPVIALHLYRNGRIRRTVDDSTLEHNFEDDGFKKGILFALFERDDYLKTADLKRHLGSKSSESVSKMIAAINDTLKEKLQLPKNKKLIESKRGSGYRLNALYNIVVT